MVPPLTCSLFSTGRKSIPPVLSVRSPSCHNQSLQSNGRMSAAGSRSQSRQCMLTNNPHDKFKQGPQPKRVPFRPTSHNPVKQFMPREADSRELRSLSPNFQASSAQSTFTSCGKPQFQPMIKPQKSYLFSDTLQEYDKQIRTARSTTPTRREGVPTPVRSTKNINKKFFDTSSRLI